MGNINPIFNDRVQYTLKSKQLESLIITEPIGWESDEKEYARHEQYHGIVAKFSNSLKFIGSGADYIQLILDLYGINEQIELIREERHPKTDIWTLTYFGYLDLSTWQYENNKISVKFNSGGLEQLIKSRESEKVEIDRLKTIDGKTIPPINPINVELDGRKIFLKSTLENSNPPDNHIGLFIASKGNTRGQIGSFPLKIISKSHEELSEVSTQETTGEDGLPTTGMMFFLNSNSRRLLKVDIDFQYTTNVFADDEINWGLYAICLTTYKDGEAYNVKNRRVLHAYSHLGFASQLGATNDFIGGGDYVLPITHQLYHNELIDLLPGESLSFEVYIVADLGTNFSPGHFGVETTGVGTIKIEEDSFQEKTKANALLAHELGDRLVTIATNQENAFYSDFLGRTDVKDINGNLLNYPINGKGSLTGFTHGFWVRGFDKLPIPSEIPFVENTFKPISTSFKEYVESMNAVWNIGIGIEKIGFRERIRLEEKSYFFNRNVTIKLPNQVKNVKRSFDTSKFYSSIDVGYELGGSYEEACGLDEYNAKSNFTTIINRLKNGFSVLSKYRADSYGMEFARRKQKNLNNTEDTPYDNNVFILDLKKVDGKFLQRKWKDDFSQKPTGIYSPETATNLRFSPFNCLMRHAWWFSGGLKKYANEFVRYGSSTANSRLKTKLRTDSNYKLDPNNTLGIGIEYAEDGIIKNSDLPAPRFLPESIEFEHVCDFNVMQQVNGSTTILGKKIQNFYGLVEFTNEKGEQETGFLMNLKPNGKGVWQVLKANR